MTVTKAFPAALLLLAAVAAAQGDLLVRAARVIPVEGSGERPTEVLIVRGRIAAVGRSLEAPEGCPVLDLPDAVVFPGLVDAGSFAGVWRHRDEETLAALPSARIADALDPRAPELVEMRRAGITTFHAIPGDRDVIAGWSAVLKVDPEGRVTWLHRDRYQKVSLVTEAWTENRAPTHVGGGLEILERHMAEAAWKGGRDLFVSLGAEREAIALARAVEAWDAAPLLFVSPDVLGTAETVAAGSRGVVLWPLLPSFPQRLREGPARLAAQGVLLGFASRCPERPAASLRLSAAMALDGGLSREAAHRALTLSAAGLLGVSDRVGSLEPGKDGDLVVLTHDPLDPRARVLAVVQDGRIVHRAEASMEAKPR